jgi:hypothetical protein
MQASCSLEGPLTEITVFFHIRPSKGNNPPLYMAPLIICVPLLGKYRDFREATF